MKKVNVHEPDAALYLVYSYQKAEFHQALEKAILSAYKKESPKSPIKVLDTEKAIASIKRVLRKFSSSNKKRGRKTDQRAIKADSYFKAALEEAKLTMAKFKLMAHQSRREFWEEKVWQKHEREIIEDESFFDGSKALVRGKDPLLTEKRRIEDLVRRSNMAKPRRAMKRKDQLRINSEKK